VARLARLAVAGCVHHVLQRGIDRRAIFRDEADFRRMLADLGGLLRAGGLALHAYVLMPDHFHLLLTPADAAALSRTMQALGRRYVRWFNQRHGRTGTLWEGRFRSTVIDPERYLLECMRYVELNPVRSALVADAATYPWSSLTHHLGLRIDPLITDHPQFWSLGNTPFERQAAYGRACAAPLDAHLVAQIRESTHRGWPLGTGEFLDALARKTVRRLTRRPVGRPRRRTLSQPA
jgi:REP-associated tyrosine transposase